MEGSLLPSSAIDTNIIQAYLETEYRAHGRPAFTLRVGQASSDLHDAHRLNNVDCSAFLTACNPLSTPFDAAANAARQALLAEELSSQGLVFVRGIGQDPTNRWPGEDSFLVFGLALDEAKSFGSKYDQNGFIWSGRDAVPQLILLR
jgi:hypothetical protein